jgi:hypothetical protein
MLRYLDPGEIPASVVDFDVVELDAGLVGAEAVVVPAAISGAT